MHYLIALIYFLLALIGLDGYGSQTVVLRSVANGVDVLYSKSQVVAGIADVACVSSASGRCHYQLWPFGCDGSRPLATAAVACDTDPLRQFVLMAGARRELVGLPAHFILCVSQDGNHRNADCASTPTQL